MVFVQKWPLFPPVFLSNIDKGNVFYDLLERKNAFQGYKNQKFKNSKNSHFYKALTNGFCPKMTIISTCFFRRYRQGKCLSRYSRTKKAYLGYKNKSSKSRKIDIFPRGLTHNFCQKMAIFPICFFWQYRQGKCLSRYFKTKKLLSRL